MKNNYKEYFLKKFKQLLKPQQFLIRVYLYNQIYLDKELLKNDYKSLELSSIEPGVLSEFILNSRN